MQEENRNIQSTSAPEWMYDLQTHKYVKWAQRKENCFAFRWGSLFKGYQRAEFTVLFYTRINRTDVTFVAMDNTNGDLYRIQYEEDLMEGPTYAIRSSKRITEQEFLQLVETFDGKIPGLKEKYSGIMAQHWTQYTHTAFAQVASPFYVAIRFAQNDRQYFLHFDDNFPFPLCFFCSARHYENWKDQHCGEVDDLLFVRDLMGGQYDAALECSRLSNKDRKIYQSCREEIFNLASQGGADDGDIEIVFVKDGLLCFKKYVSDESLKERVLQMYTLMGYVAG